MIEDMKSIYDLSGKELNILTTKACNYDWREFDLESYDYIVGWEESIEVYAENIDCWVEFDPLNWWNDCGLLLEKFNISVQYNTFNLDPNKKWVGWYWKGDEYNKEEEVYGSTPQQAIVRAVVLHKFGNDCSEICLNNLDSK